MLMCAIMAGMIQLRRRGAPKTGVKLASCLKKGGVWLMLLSLVFGLAAFFPTANTAYAEEGDAVLPGEVLEGTGELDELADPQQQVGEDDTLPEQGDTTDPEGVFGAGSTSDTTATSAGSTSGSENKSDCPQDAAGAVGWLICPVTRFLATTGDALTDFLRDFLVVKPITEDTGSPVPKIWEYMRDIANILFIIALLVVVLAQVTNIGLNNYSVKKILPRLVVTAILVNLSFIVCAIAIDVSNILGESLRGLFDGIIASTMMTAEGAPITAETRITWSAAMDWLVAGGVGAVGAGVVGFAVVGGVAGLLPMLVIGILTAVVALIAAVVTLAARQALVILLVAVAPLAFVAYLLPNTEKWFTKWKDLLGQMLILFPMFSLLFGASNLAGWAIIKGAPNMQMVILGLAVQVVPFIMTPKLLTMSKSILGGINKGVRRPFQPALRKLGTWGGERRELGRRSMVAFGRGPSAALMRFMENNRKFRQDRIQDADSAAKNRAAIYSDGRMGAVTANGEISKAGARHKTAAVVKGEAENAALDLDHKMDNYGDTYGNKKGSLVDTRAHIRARSLADRSWKSYQYAGMAATRAAAQAVADERERNDALRAAFEAGQKDTNNADFLRLVKPAADVLGGEEGKQFVAGRAMATFKKLERESFESLKAYYDTNLVSNKQVRRNLEKAIEDGDKVGVTAGADRLAAIGQGFEVFEALKNVEKRAGDYTKLHGGDKSKILETMRHLQSTIVNNQVLRKEHVHLANWAKRIVTPAGQVAFFDKDGNDLVPGSEDYDKSMSMSGITKFMKAYRGFDEIKDEEAKKFDYADQENLNRDIDLLQYNRDGSFNFDASRMDAKHAAIVIANGAEAPKTARHMLEAYFYGRDIDVDTDDEGKEFQYLKVNKSKKDYRGMEAIAKNFSGTDWGNILNTTFDILADKNTIDNMHVGVKTDIWQTLDKTLRNTNVTSRMDQERVKALTKYKNDLGLSLPTTPPTP